MIGCQAIIVVGRPRRRTRNGFTMLELMIVVALIGVLVALLLPAVQSAREQARAAQCENHLSQIWLAARSYDSAFGVFPAGTIAGRTPIHYFADDLHVSWTIAVQSQWSGGEPFAQNWNDSLSVYDPANWPLSEKSPSVLHCASSILYSERFSSYAAIHDGRAAPIDEQSRGAFVANRYLSVDDMADGLSTTAFFGEIRADGEEHTYLSWLSGTQATLRTTGLPPVTGDVRRTTQISVGYPYGWFLGTGKQSYEDYLRWISGNPRLDAATLTPRQLARLNARVHSPPPMPTAAAAGDNAAEGAADGGAADGGASRATADSATADDGADTVAGIVEAAAGDEPVAGGYAADDAAGYGTGGYGGGYGGYGTGGYGGGYGGYGTGGYGGIAAAAAPPMFPCPVIPASTAPMPLGSFHAAGVQLAMGDGRVSLIAPTIDQRVYAQLGVRDDSLPLVYPLTEEGP